MAYFIPDIFIFDMYERFVSFNDCLWIMQKYIATLSENSLDVAKPVSRKGANLACFPVISSVSEHYGDKPANHLHKIMFPMDEVTTL